MAKARGGLNARESVSNPSVSKYARLSEDVATGHVSWEEVDGRIVKAALVATTEDGCALILGKTSDGGALSLTLLNPGTPVKKWFKTAALAESFLQELVATTAA